MREHCLASALEPRSGTTESLLSSETLIQRDSNETFIILAGDSSVNNLSSVYPTLSQDGEILLAHHPSQNTQAFEMDMLRYENVHDHLQDLFAQPFENSAGLSSFNINLDLLDRLSEGSSPRSYGLGPVPTQGELPSFLSEVMWPPRSNHQVFNKFEEYNEESVIKLIIFMLDNNLLDEDTENRKLVLQYAKTLSSEAVKSISLDFCDFETAETAEKLFYFALEANSKSLITTIIRSGLQLPEQLIDATFVFALRNQDLNLVQFLMQTHVNLESKDPCTNRENWFVRKSCCHWKMSGELDYDMLSAPSWLEDSGSYFGGSEMIFAKAAARKHNELYYYDQKNGKGSYYRNRIHSSLEFASSRRDLQLVQFLLKANASPKTVPDVLSKDVLFREINPLTAVLNSIDTSGTLMEVAGQNQPSSDELVILEIVQTLVEAGADVNSTIECIRSSPSHEICPPICAAAFQGYSSVVRYLLPKGAKIQVGSPGQNALILLSMRTKKLDSGILCYIARSLIQAGIDVNFGGLDECIPLDLAIKNQSLELVDLLLASGAALSGETLYEAIESGCLQIVHHILDSMPITMNPLDVMELAATRGMNDVIPKLLDLAHERGFSWPIAMNPLDVIALAANKGVNDVTPKLLDLAHEKGYSWPTPHSDRHSMSHIKPTVEVIEALLGFGFMPSPHEASDCIGSLIAFQPRNLELLRRFLALAIDHYWNSGGDDCAYCDSRTESTLLYAAIIVGDFELADLLIECGVVGCSATMDAVLENGNFHLFYRLQEARLLQTRSENDSWILERYYTVLKGHHLILVKLLAREESCFMLQPEIASVNSEYTFTKAAIQTANMDGIKYLFEMGFGLNRFWLEESLAHAVQFRQHDILLQLFQAYQERYGACDRGFGSKALQNAIYLKSGFEESEELNNLEDLKEWGLIAGETLLSFGVDPGFMAMNGEYSGSSAFGLVIRSPSITGKLEWLAMILKKVTDKDDIVESRNVSRKANVTKVLDRNFSSLDDLELIYYTPLLAAIESGDISTINLLLEAGANVNLPATFQTRKTPLQAACASGSLEIFLLLLNKGADVHAPAAKYKGGTALQFAAIVGHLGMVYVLLEKKVNVNAPGARIGGRTAIEGAAEHGRVGVLELLLECGGVKIVGDGEDQYQRALTFADKNGHRKAKFMLEQAKEKSRKKVVANEVPLGLM